MIEPTSSPHRSRRWLWVLQFLALVIVAAGLFYLVVNEIQARGPLTAREQVMIGTWKLKPTVPNPLGVLEYEFLPDRTCRIRFINSTTGTVLGDNQDMIWWCEGDRLIVVHAQSLVAPWWSVQRSHDLHEEFTLKPVTPNEYEYEVRFNPPVPGSTTSTGRLIRP